MKLKSKTENEMLKMTTFLCPTNVDITHLNYNTLLLSGINFVISQSNCLVVVVINLAVLENICLIVANQDK